MSVVGFFAPYIRYKEFFIDCIALVLIQQCNNMMIVAAPFNCSHSFQAGRFCLLAAQLSPAKSRRAWNKGKELNSV